MLPKPIYELMPYFYLSGGITEIYYLQSTIATVSGVLFFVAGAMIWILRSNHRRCDSQLSRKRDARLPEELYEMLPFLYMLVGALLVTFSTSYLLYAIAALLFLAGLHFVVVRTVHRRTEPVFG